MAKTRKAFCYRAQKRMFSVNFMTLSMINVAL